MPTPSSSTSKHQRSNTAVGCMSGLFHFLSRHHNHSRKRLTSSKKKERTVVIHSAPPQPPPPPAKTLAPPINNTIQCYVAPRSPTIAAEIRRRPASSSPTTHPTSAVDSPRRPPALVARLMGLEEAAPTPETASEKRRKLLGALEKCDEDLQTLKKIIQAVRLVDEKTKTVDSVVTVTAGLVCNGGADGLELESNGEQPSPVSVLDAISSPRFRSKRFDTDKQSGNRIVKPSRMGGVFSGDQCKRNQERDENCALNRPVIIEVLPLPSYQMKDSIVESCRRRQSGWKMRSLSKALIASVGEVWEDGLLEERWELGRMVFRLEFEIYYDLVEELVFELLDYCYQFYFRGRSSRKRLCF